MISVTSDSAPVPVRPDCNGLGCCSIRLAFISFWNIPNISLFIFQKGYKKHREIDQSDIILSELADDIKQGKKVLWNGCTGEILPYSTRTLQPITCFTCSSLEASAALVQIEIK